MMVPDFDIICRLCLAENDNMVLIFDESGKSRSRLCQRIENCTCLKISKSDGLPTAICIVCLNKLDQIKEFQDQCERSDTMLRQYLRAKESNERQGRKRGIMEDRRKGHGRTRRDSASERRRKKVDSSHGKTDNFAEEKPSSNVVSAGLLLKQEPAVLVKQEDVELHLEVTLPSSKPSGMEFLECTKSVDCKNQNDNSEDEEHDMDDEDNEYTWPGSLSDKEVEQNSSAEQQTERNGSNNEDIKRQKKRARSQRSYECEFCGRVFPRSNHLAQHELTHTKDKPFHCSCCEKSFWYKNSLIGHIKQNHTGDVNYTCEECGRGFFQRSAFNRHKPIHSTETPFKCSECGMAFKLVKNLRRHQKVHTGLRTHTCQYCGKSFRMLQTLRVHLILHTGEKPFKCTYCGKGFSQSAPLKAHIRMHTGERPYVCNVCGEAFPTGNALKAHTFKHTGIHPNSCKDCSVVFKRKRDLIEHRDQVHNGAVTEPLQVTPLLPQDQPNIKEKSQEQILHQTSAMEPLQPPALKNTDACQSVSVSQVLQSPSQSHQFVQHNLIHSHLLPESIPPHLINPSLLGSRTLQES